MTAIQEYMTSVQEQMHLQEQAFTGIKQTQATQSLQNKITTRGTTREQQQAETDKIQKTLELKVNQ